MHAVGVFFPQSKPVIPEGCYFLTLFFLYRIVNALCTSGIRTAEVYMASLKVLREDVRSILEQLGNQVDDALKKLDKAKPENIQTMAVRITGSALETERRSVELMVLTKERKGKRR